MLGRSFYVIYGLGRGTRAVRIITWLAAVFVLLFWTWRLATSQSVFWG